MEEDLRKKDELLREKRDLLAAEQELKVDRFLAQLNRAVFVECRCC